ncbi:MAG: hypothetical protein KKI09_06285 [Spirochaetes bacterium]|nr:hypothetical protein [Spirochaetota bacterium]MBU0955019.1 hypothetical protein [Spirochaetota bacterium]
MNEIAVRQQIKAEREQRLAELKRKVHDEVYLSWAIQRIAQVMSAEIIQGYGVTDGRRTQG